MKPLTIYFFILTILLSSCNKLVEVDTPSDRVQGATVFTSDAPALSAVSGMYAQMIRSNMQFSSAAITVYGSLSADEFTNTTSVATTDEYALNNLSAGNGTLRTNLWLPAYQLIFQANNIIEGLNTSTGVSPALRKQLTGEAKFIRAFTHFYLANLFGDVPLITSTDYRLTAALPRHQVADVLASVVADLTDARQLLSSTYPSAGRVRVNARAASALLSRVYLYTGDWQKAEDEASLVIADPAYALVTNLNNVFLAGSTETIWQLMPVSTTTNTWEGNIFIPTGTTVPAYVLSSGLMNAFTPTDARKAAWTKSVTVGSNTYQYPFKYKIKTATTLSEYYVVLRLAEQYLIRAEARAQLGKLTEARQDLDKIRTRASLLPATVTDAASLLAAIEKERQLELFAEWGHRWFDLKRTGRSGAVLSPLKPGWSANDVLYPIPQQEINRNPLLTQNPGY